MSSLRDQVALVTGSSRGIGAAIANSFAQQGGKVVVHGRDGAALSFIRKEIELAGGRSCGSSWESEELNERPHALFLTATRKSLGPCELGDTMKARPKQFRHYL